MTDAEKLRVLATWIDKVYDPTYGSKGTEVQDDLRRIADRLEKIDDAGVRV